MKMLRRKRHGKTKVPAEDRQKEDREAIASKINTIADELKGNSPSLEDLDELETMEPPFPSFPGPSGKEMLAKLRKQKKPSPYL